MAENYYQTLGVDRHASAEEIKKSYRKLARKYHPDVSKEADAEEKMQAINVAYDTLNNPEKKAEYDQMLDNPQGFAGFGQGAQGQGGFDGAHFYRQSTGGGEHADFSGFEDLFGRFGAGFGGSGSRRQQQSFQGEDQHAKIEVDLDVAYTGTTQQITLQIPTYNAHGEPEIQRKTLQVKIPKGMKEGQQIRLSGQGQAGINGGKAGDLYIEIQYKEDKRLYVEGADVYTTIDVSPWEAALGGQVEVNTPAGRLQINLPANAKNGQQLRLKGKGIPNSKEAGNLYLIINIVLPTAQNDQQKQAYQQLAQAFNAYNPRA
ncbi:DnaJ C-terminal domain-containing protein [Acinetobacter populi]|uniref:DNA-binding protein n=1 Tax=Acinetobacter populi TaxID=1582270 RepID=A0A1Z9YWR7_9GAMM|nr:DnaJ C-terminal domain-containing protein [Acinetobacter populi]OUY06661.1 DNA-binding protein [Acinetobacter populi]